MTTRLTRQFDSNLAAHLPAQDADSFLGVQELIHAYRVRGHLLADIDPLDYKQRKHPDLVLRETAPR